jgi:hypothetical protein
MKLVPISEAAAHAEIDSFCEQQTNYFAREFVSASSARRYGAFSETVEYKAHHLKADLIRQINEKIQILDAEYATGASASLTSIYPFGSCNPREPIYPRHVQNAGAMRYHFDLPARILKLQVWERDPTSCPVDNDEGIRVSSETLCTLNEFLPRPRNGPPVLERNGQWFKQTD